MSRHLCTIFVALLLSSSLSLLSAKKSQKQKVRSRRAADLSSNILPDNIRLAVDEIDQNDFELNSDQLFESNTIVANRDVGKEDVDRIVFYDKPTGQDTKSKAKFASSKFTGGSPSQSEYVTLPRSLVDNFLQKLKKDKNFPIVGDSFDLPAISDLDLEREAVKFDDISDEYEVPDLDVDSEKPVTRPPATVDEEEEEETVEEIEEVVDSSEPSGGDDLCRPVCANYCVNYPKPTETLVPVQTETSEVQCRRECHYVRPQTSAVRYVRPQTGTVRYVRPQTSAVRYYYVNSGRHGSRALNVDRASSNYYYVPYRSRSSRLGGLSKKKGGGKGKGRFKRSLSKLFGDKKGGSGGGKKGGGKSEPSRTYTTTPSELVCTNQCYRVPIKGPVTYVKRTTQKSAKKCQWLCENPCDIDGLPRRQK